MVNIGLTQEECDQSVTLLEGLLADHFTLLLKIWQFHWNVTGPSFGSYHERMKELYDAEIEFVDSTAERIRALGGRPLGSMEAMLQHNRIQEWTDKLADAMEMWAVINEDSEAVIRRIREIHEQVSAQDLGTRNFLEDMITRMEKDAWMTRSLLSPTVTTTTQ